jgi:energy-coupling factor transporter ATP-binding protein EcfA2
MRFRARNFRSLKEEQELSLVASSLKDSPEAVTQVEGLNLGLVRVAAIYGANASGKSNVIKALAYMSSAVQNSHRQWAPEGPIPREPFLLDPQSKLDPSSFEVDLLLDGMRFHYGFTLNDREILEEWLDAYPIGKRQMWFKRKQRVFTFGKKLVGDNAAIERLTRPNSLFLSAAAQNNHEGLLPLYRWFVERFGYVPRERGPAVFNTALMCKDEGFKSWVSEALRSADMGIVDLQVREEEFAFPPPPPELGKEAKLLAEEFARTVRRFAEKAKQQSNDGSSLPEKMLTVSLIHKGSSRLGVPFGLGNESDGTVAFYGLLGPLVHFVGSGGTLCVDELDASLHPLLALGVLHFFRNPKLNPRGAQIIFTTHDTNILDRASLRRDQIWFTEKDAEGGTHLYPLTDFKLRKNENLERGYLQGRYGAVPFIGSPDFLANLHEKKAEH